MTVSPQLIATLPAMSSVCCTFFYSTLNSRGARQRDWTKWFAIDEGSYPRDKQHIVHSSIRLFGFHSPRNCPRERFLSISGCKPKQRNFETRVKTLSPASFFLFFWLVSSGLCRKGHGTGSDTSGSSTPFFASGSVTPVDENQDGFLNAEEQVTALSEKFRDRESFHKARVVPAVSTHIPSKGLSKEHQEQGRVKIDVYKRYIQAASKAGFAFFLFATIAQQAASVMATLTLRYWGEHNRENGSNSGMFQYLLVYGLFSLSSSLLGAISAITMWVYCALRSAKRLHDAVSVASSL